MTTQLGQLPGAVAEAKAGNPLASVTIVVPSVGAGRDVLHHLARTRTVANIEVLTVPRLVSKCAAPVLAPREALPYPLLEAAIQRVLAEEPGLFRDVAEEPITAQALAGAAWELTALGQPAMESPTPLVADLLRVYRIVVERLSDRYYLQHEAFTAAGQNTRAPGSLILYCLRPTAAAERAFISRLHPVAVVEAEPTVTPTQVVHTSDADDEVRAIVRLVRKRLANGVPGHRIGIFYPADDPYLPLLHEHLSAGHIGFTAPACHTLVDRPAGRALLGLLELDHEKMPRRELFTLLAEGALRRPEVNDQPISQHRLEILTRRDEPIVGGSDWQRLTQVGAHEKHHPAAVAVHTYIKQLQSQLENIVASPTWEAVARELGTLIETQFRTPASDIAITDLRTIRADCADLAHMDGIAPPLNGARVLDAVAVRLRAHRGTHGTSGEGVTVAPIAVAAGRDLDVSIVVGAAEGLVPQPRRDDPLLPPELVGISARDHIQAQYHAFASAVSAGHNERIVSFPRGNLRGGAEKVPSRWLIPALANLSNRDVDVVRWQQQTAGVSTIVAVESFDVAAQRADDRIGASAASETEWCLRELASVPANRRRGTLNDPTINLGMEMRSDRLNGRFTRFNGNLGSVRELITTFDHPVSPTGLEQWVASPYQYFLEHILRLQALDDPDEIAQIDALTRGTLIHKILERYVLDTIEGAQLDYRRLNQIAQDLLDEAQANSPGWLEQLWAKDRGVITRDLADWYHHDTDDHIAGWRPTAAERDFGTEHDVPLNLSSSVIRFRGQIDRIDKHADGRIRVTDYKTGKADKYRDLCDDTPTNSGLQFQLPVYGILARTLGDNVEARYWFVTAKGQFKSIGYAVTDDVIGTLAADMELVYRHITAGHFPPKIEDTHWELPVVDLLGRAGLRRAWANLENVDDLADYLAKYGG